MWILKSMKVFDRGYFEIKLMRGEEIRSTRFYIKRDPVDQDDLNKMMASELYVSLKFLTTSGGNSGGYESEDQKPD